MALSAADKTKVRSSQIQTIDVAFDVYPPTIVATATVATTPTDYPLAEVSVTGTSAGWSDIKVGQLYKIEDTSNNLVTWGAIRLPATASILKIDAKSKADSGRAVSTHRNIESGDTVTVYEAPSIWTLLSRIKDGEFLKKFDVSYDGSGANPPPVANLGASRAVTVDNGETYATVTFDASSSFSWKSGSLSYSWTLPSGSTVTAGSTSSASVTFQAPEGDHLVECTVTDGTTGTSMTGRRMLWVHSDSNKPISENYAVEIGSDTQDRKGRSIDITLTGGVDETTILPGTPAVLRQTAKYDGSELSSGTHIDTFIGFIGDIEYTYEGGVTGEKGISFEVKSPYQWFEEIPMVSQVINEVASPSAWEEVENGLSDVNFAIWYILKHHTTYLELFDYYKLTDLSPPRKRIFGLSGTTVSQYLDEIASFVLGNIGCSSNGSLYFRRHPSYEDNTFRDNLENLITYDINDLIDKPTINRNYLNSTSFVRAYAFQYTGSGDPTAFGSIAPGNQQGQSTGSEETEKLLLPPNVDGQTKLNEISGHMYAKSNVEYESISLSFLRNYDFMNPAKMKWVELSLTATESPISEALSSRLLPMSIDRNWEQLDDGSWIKNISGTFEFETFGQPGVTINIETGYSTEEYVDEVEFVYNSTIGAGSEDNVSLSDYTPFIIATDENGNIGGTINGANWLSLRGNIDSTEEIWSFAVDWSSKRIENGWQSGALGMWCVTVDTSNNVKVYYTQNIIKSDVTWTEQHSISFVSTFELACNIITTPDNADMIVITVNDGGRGTWLIRTTNSGTSWSEERVGEIFFRGENIGKQIPVAIDDSGSRVITAAPLSSGYWTIYASSTALGSLSTVDETNILSDTVIYGIEIKDTLDIIVSYDEYSSQEIRRGLYYYNFNQSEVQYNPSIHDDVQHILGSYSKNIPSYVSSEFYSSDSFFTFGAGLVGDGLSGSDAWGATATTLNPGTQVDWVVLNIDLLRVSWLNDLTFNIYTDGADIELDILRVVDNDATTGDTEQIVQSIAISDLSGSWQEYNLADDLDEDINGLSTNLIFVARPQSVPVEVRFDNVSIMHDEQTRCVNLSYIPSESSFSSPDWNGYEGYTSNALDTLTTDGSNPEEGQVFRIDTVSAGSPSEMGIKVLLNEEKRIWKFGFRYYALSDDGGDPNFVAKYIIEDSGGSVVESGEFSASVIESSPSGYTYIEQELDSPVTGSDVTLYIEEETSGDRQVWISKAFVRLRDARAIVNPTYTVDYSGSGFSFSNSDDFFATTATIGVTANGNPAEAYTADIGAYGGGGTEESITTTITLPSDITITDVLMDTYIDGTSGSTEHRPLVKIADSSESGDTFWMVNYRDLAEEYTDASWIEGFSWNARLTTVDSIPFPLSYNEYAITYQVGSNSFTDADWRIDNVKVVQEQNANSSRDKKVYLIENYNSSPSITDISTSDSANNEYPFGLFIDPISNDTIYMIGTDNVDATNYYKTNDGGTNWTETTVSNSYRGVLQVGFNGILWGSSIFRLFEDNVSNTYNLTGNWDNAFNETATTWRQILAIL